MATAPASVYVSILPINICVGLSPNIVNTGPTVSAIIFTSRVPILILPAPS